MKFNADVVIRYLTDVLEIEEVEDFKDLPLKGDFFDMMNEPKDEWDLSYVEPSQILEIIILEKLLLSRCHSMDLEEVLEEFYFPHFHPTFFDPEPRPILSIAGWLNYNYSREYEVEANHLPPLSLYPAVEAINILVEASPTCDEMITEYITDMYLGFRDNDEPEDAREFFWGVGADHIYNLSKALRQITPCIHRLAENSFEDDLPYALGQLILEELGDEFLEVLLTDFQEETIRAHPLLLVANQIEDLKELYTDH